MAEVNTAHVERDIRNPDVQCMYIRIPHALRDAFNDIVQANRGHEKDDRLLVDHGAKHDSFDCHRKANHHNQRYRKGTIGDGAVGNQGNHGQSQQNADRPLGRLNRGGQHQEQKHRDKHGPPHVLSAIHEECQHQQYDSRNKQRHSFQIFVRKFLDGAFAFLLRLIQKVHDCRCTCQSNRKPAGPHPKVPRNLGQQDKSQCAKQHQCALCKIED